MGQPFLSLAGDFFGNISAVFDNVTPEGHIQPAVVHEDIVKLKAVHIASQQGSAGLWVVFAYIVKGVDKKPISEYEKRAGILYRLGIGYTHSFLT